MAQQNILLIVGGGIAAYKACELVRLLRQDGIGVRVVLTAAGAQFITPMTLQALSGERVYTDLFSLTDESEMGHIQLSRWASLIVVCPATADLMARMATGQADDLAATLLLATDAPVLAVPAMNVRMWAHPATRRNVAQLRADGITVMPPDEGDMACGEYGEGRLPDPLRIAALVKQMLASPGRAPMTPDIAGNGPLHGRHVIVTAGPTHEPIDPVRYLANRSSGKQGFAIAAAAAAAGARVTLVAGPVSLATPPGVERVDVESARDMLAATMAALPADVAIMAAAVADWRVEPAGDKIKKDGSGATPTLVLRENPDILATVAKGTPRPALVIGFAAETRDLLAHAEDKLSRKGCDWIVANDVSGGVDGVMGGERNQVHILRREGVERWDDMPKTAVAAQLVEDIIKTLAERS